MWKLLCLSAAFWIVLGVDQKANAAATNDQFLSISQDSDQDGLSDDVEQGLLKQFAPKFIISRQDCSNMPAEFISLGSEPIVQKENGTIYGQVFPTRVAGSSNPTVEIHYYHLWKRDCGRMGHQLDTEHVSTLVRMTDTGKWKALYWYAAAHEDTVCDASQISRAPTLQAEDHGATVWISAGKHASFLNETLCSRGCGGDACLEMVPLRLAEIVNLGESRAPMNGALWTASSRWPLSTKMGRTDFEPAVVARLGRLPASDIAWVNPGRRPAQATVAAGDSTVNALAASNKNTDTAVSNAGNATGSALGKTYRNVSRSLGASAHGVGKFLGYDAAPSH
jgi:hypothetical protein